MSQISTLQDYWKQLYPDEPDEALNIFLHEIKKTASENKLTDYQDDWYKDCVVYSLYVDHFHHDFSGLKEKLDYLSDLGVNCLWLLPVLESPMRDAGFDISDHYRIRKELTSQHRENPNTEFAIFLKEAHYRNIRVIFDLAVNHTSEEHPWFVESRKSRENPFRNFYIWSDNPERYGQARVIFKGIEASNWSVSGDENYFHRFFHFQPDLNYANPLVLLEMCRVLLFWKQQGVDGFRLDAIPYLWKEENTDCENLPQTHILVKFFRAVLDLVKPGTLLLAEACQRPREVVQYFGDADECQAAYHFPLMPRIFLAIAKQDRKVIESILSPEVTPPIPEHNQWFTFLRCHDELSLEKVYVSEEERAFLYGYYCKDPSWDFRLGEGISARLADLLDGNPRKILLAFSILLTLPGSPVIYYGDEFGKTNDQKFHQEMTAITGNNDSRYLVRGRIDWEEQQHLLSDESSWQYVVFHGLKKMLRIRNLHKSFGRGKISFAFSGKPENDTLLSYTISYQNRKMLIINNLTNDSKQLNLTNFHSDATDLLGNDLSLALEGFGFRWIAL